MKFSDLFEIEGSLNEPNRTVALRLRLFGIDFEFSAMGYLDDMIFPFLFIPSLRGFAFQVLFLGLFVGRVVKEKSYTIPQEEEEWD